MNKNMHITFLFINQLLDSMHVLKGNSSCNNLQKKIPKTSSNLKIKDIAAL